jgi:DNA-binding FadR family transcriptional regulator
MTQDRVRVPKSAELVAQALRRRIVRGSLHEGDGLPPENVLMQQFGVSRPTLREAFRILESEQLITIQRGARGGGRVHAPTAEVAARYAALVLQHEGTTLRDVYRARAVVESACAGLLAGHRTSQQLRQLRGVLEAQRDDASDEFHRMVVELAGNRTLALLSRMVQQILTQATPAPDGVPATGSDQAARRRLARVQRAHAELLGHIEHKDVAAAEALWAKHLGDLPTAAAAGLDEPLDIIH